MTPLRGRFARAGRWLHNAVSLVPAIAAIVGLTHGAARAFPEGAPWGAADPRAERNCGTCHFESDPVMESGRLAITGLPARVEPGAAYDLVIALRDPDAVIAGFQLIASAVGQPAGAFIVDGTGIEVEPFGAAVRSTTPLSATDGLSWSLRWRAPSKMESDIVFHAAASAANDDGSPFGDIIHFRSYRLAAPDAAPEDQAQRNRPPPAGH